MSGTLGPMQDYLGLYKAHQDIVSLDLTTYINEFKSNPELTVAGIKQEVQSHLDAKKVTFMCVLLLVYVSTCVCT